MKHLIITTVGTSIFTNYQKKEVETAWENADKYRGISDYRMLEAKNDSASQYSASDYEKAENKIEQYWLKGIKKIDEAWIVSENTPNRHASAEITSIIEIAQKIRKDDNNAEIEVQLLATDTALSVSAAKLIGLFFEDSDMVSVRKFVKETDFVASLGVKPKSGDVADTYYDAGLQNLVDKLMGEAGIIRKAKKDGLNPVINFSGGYKSTIPVLTIIAQLENIPMYYIYEDSDHLMEVGNLPFDFDWAAVERLHYYLDSDLLNDDLGSEILEELKDRKLIALSKSGYKVSPLGRLFRNARDVMPDGGGTFGKIVEVKLWEHFVKNPLTDFSSKFPKRSLACHRHDLTGEIVEIIPEDEKGNNLYKGIEIDLTFYASDGNYAILESKSISGIKGVKPELYFAGGKFHNDGKLPALFSLVVYKYEHEKLTSRKQQLLDLKSQVHALGVPNFQFFYFNLPLSKDKARVNYQTFIDSESIVLVNGLEELGI
ncbi:MAG: hypothetical protein KIPDCIKN_03059 [Haliscomenobacter sp.]|jgi:putative CRISPR-associated protein (TIGR02619 family)|nr:hypothetical protein [Haliscomenobacter sp.]